MPKSLLALLIASTFAVGPAARAATYAVEYELPRAGNLSLAIFDAQGRSVREILRAAPEEAGRHRLVWDGLDAGGRGVPAGEYHWKLLETQGLSVHYELSVGSNYPIGTDLSSSGGPGTHVAPFAVATDETGIYIAALQTENIETGLLKLSPDGKQRLWSQLLPGDLNGQVAWEGARSLAVEGGEVYLLGHNDRQHVYVSDARTGRGTRSFDVGWDPPTPEKTVEPTHGATDMSVFGGVVAVAYLSKGAVRWYKAATGALIATAEVPHPAGIALGPDGVTYVTTSDRLVRLAPHHPESQVVKAGLVEPGRVDVDRARGDVLVFQRGASQQVVRLSPVGALLAAYGARGGRRDGLYVDRDFAGVTDIAADGKGGFFVAEADSAPRRVAHLSAAGVVLAEWYGGQPWATSGVFEPGRPDVMWVASAYAGLTHDHTVIRAVIDYAHHSWRVHSTYRYTSASNPLMSASGNEGNKFHLYEHAGSKYLVVEGSPSISKVDEKGWRLVPVTGFGDHFQWNDANGDGLVQDAEKLVIADPLPAYFRGGHVDAAFDFYYMRTAAEDCEVRRVRVAGWNAVGAPVYGPPNGEHYADCPERFRGTSGDWRWSVFLHHDAASGELYAALNPGTIEWCTSTDSYVQNWSSSAGRLGWTAGGLGPAPTSLSGMARSIPTDPGFIYWNLRGLSGVAHGCVVATDVDGGWTGETAHTYVWDRDGLFVGGIMDTPDLDGIPKFMYQCGGEFAHSALYTLPDGDVLFAGNWENEVRVYRVKGWDGVASPWVRLSGTITVREPSRDETGQGLAVEPGDNGAGARWRGTLRPRYGPRYEGIWVPMRRPEAFEGTFREARSPNARVTCRFRGRSISIVSLKNPNCGLANVYVDGVLAAANRDCWAAEGARDAVVFEQSGLRRGDHTVTVQALAAHDPNANHPALFNVDKFVVDGTPIDDDGLAHVFSVRGADRAQLRLDGVTLIGPGQAASGPVKLLVEDHPIQIDARRDTRLDARGVGLSWSNPLEVKESVPVTALFPVVAR
jgi:hypothetical protein